MSKKPKLLDVIKLSVDLPEYNLQYGAEGTIVECYSNNAYEVEFINQRGETIALCTLSSDQFEVIWQASPKTTSRRS
jgi:hypothetical protein